MAQVARGGEILPPQPAAQEAGHERVARPEHVEHFDRKPAADDSGFEIVGDRPVIDDAALSAALEHDGRAGDRADRLERLEHAVGADGDHDLLFRADDQVAIGEHGPEPRRHHVRLHVALETRVMAGEAPEVGPIVDVEDHLAAVRLGQRDRFRLRGGGGGPRKMRPGHDDRMGSGDEGLVDVAFVERHVGAVRAIERHRRDALARDGQQHQRRQTLAVDMDAVDGDALANELFADEAAHLLRADPRDQRGLESEARRADGDVGRAAADRFGEAADVFEPAADLLAVEVDQRAADGDQVERRVHGLAARHLTFADADSGRPPVQPDRQKPTGSAQASVDARPPSGQ